MKFGWGPVGPCRAAFSALLLVLVGGSIATAHAATNKRSAVQHGTEPDPVFFYGNRLALELFGMDFAAFTRLPSRFSAEPLLREERALLLERVTRDGFIDDYSGIRIAACGRCANAL